MWRGAELITIDSLLFEAEFLLTEQAAQLNCCSSDRVITLAGNRQAAARAVITAARVAYRRLPVCLGAGTAGWD